MLLRIAGSTVNQTPFDWKNNTENIIAAIEEAKRLQVNILCLPELCITGYGCEDVFLSNWLHDRAWEELSIIKAHCEDITVVLGLPIRIENACYSSACVIRDKNALGIVCKQHLALDGVHYEPRWFQAWPSGKVVTYQKNEITLPVGDLTFDIQGIRLGIEICEDGWRGKDRPGYSLAERGVDLILNPSASHFAMGKSDIREEVVILDATRQFNCTYVFANLIGNEAGRIIYDGDIVIAHHDKIVLQDSRLSFARYKVASADINFKSTDQPTCNLLDIKDRNEELVKATSLGLYDYLRKCGAHGFVLSLSGGADSATCAVMVAEMIRRASAELGWTKFCNTLGLDENVIQGSWQKAVGSLLTCAYQATKNSSPQTLAAAKKLAASLGATFYEWHIDDEVDSYTKKIEQALGRSLTWEKDDISLQNIQARSRSPIIWMLANINKALLLTTSNRSEGDVGYTTMDGDTSGSLAPIAGLSKPFILQWLRWAEKNLQYKGLNLVNAQQPTAELRPLENHQTDEDDLMPYAILEQIEKLAIQKRLSPIQVFKEMRGHLYSDRDLKVYIKKFYTLWSRNQWKRERIAPSFHLDEINVDPRSWCRFPILSGGFIEELAALDDNNI